MAAVEASTSVVVLVAAPLIAHLPAIVSEVEIAAVVVPVPIGKDVVQ